MILVHYIAGIARAQYEKILGSYWPILLAWNCRSDEGPTLEMSAFLFITVANLHFQLSWYNQITLIRLRLPALIPRKKKKRTYKVRSFGTMSAMDRKKPQKVIKKNKSQMNLVKLKC